MRKSPRSCESQFKSARGALRKILANNQGGVKLIGFFFQRDLKRKKRSTPIDMGKKANSDFIENGGTDKYRALAQYRGHDFSNRAAIAVKIAVKIPLAQRVLQARP
jgi:hypothetical protein